MPTMEAVSVIPGEGDLLVLALRAGALWTEGDGDLLPGGAGQGHERSPLWRLWREPVLPWRDLFSLLTSRRINVSLC